MGQGVLPSDLSLLMVDTQLSRDGTTLDLVDPVVSGTTFTYTIQLNSFGRNDSGDYVCTANVTLLQPSTYLTGMGRATDMSEVVIGEQRFQFRVNCRGSVVIHGGRGLRRPLPDIYPYSPVS